jgi:hypothetical protein
MPWFAYCPNTITIAQNTWVNTTTTTSGTVPTYFNQTNVIYPQTSSLTNIQNTRMYYWVNGSGGYEPQSSIVRPTRRRPEPRPIRTPAEPRSPTAFDRARELLLSHLTEEQRATFIENKWFVVVGGRSRMRYRIETGHLVANVRRLDDGARLCAHCDHTLPMDDHLIAQKLMLEYDEDAFLAIANRH